MRLGVQMFISLWNLAGISAALLPSRLSYSSDWKLWTSRSRAFEILQYWHLRELIRYLAPWHHYTKTHYDWHWVDAEFMFVIIRMLMYVSICPCPHPWTDSVPAIPEQSIGLHAARFYPRTFREGSGRRSVIRTPNWLHINCPSVYHRAE